MNLRSAGCKKICSYCKKEFKISPSRLDKRRCCSRGCNMKYRHLTEDIGFKKDHKNWDHANCKKNWFNKEQMKGNKNGFKKGECMGNNNYAKRKEVREKISKKLKGRRNYWQEGEKHFNWKGGKSYEEYPKEFYNIRREIIIRDKYYCKLCGKLIKKQTKKLFISVHHIDYNKLNNKSENLISLCNCCNSKVNYNRKKWQRAFKGVMQNGE